MKLYDMMTVIKDKFKVEELRAYLYKDKIEFIDFTPGYKGSKDFYGGLFTIYVDHNVIISIDNESMHFINDKNKDCISYLIGLIGTEIEGYQYFPKLDSIENMYYEKV